LVGSDVQNYIGVSVRQVTSKRLLRSAGGAVRRENVIADHSLQFQLLLSGHDLYTFLTNLTFWMYWFMQTFYSKGSGIRKGVKNLL